MFVCRGLGLIVWVDGIFIRGQLNCNMIFSTFMSSVLLSTNVIAAH